MSIKYLISLERTRLESILLPHLSITYHGSISYIILISILSQNPKVYR